MCLQVFSPRLEAQLKMTCSSRFAAGFSSWLFRFAQVVTNGKRELLCEAVKENTPWPHIGSQPEVRARLKTDTDCYNSFSPLYTPSSSSLTRMLRFSSRRLLLYSASKLRLSTFPQSKRRSCTFDIWYKKRPHRLGIIWAVYPLWIQCCLCNWGKMCICIRRRVAVKKGSSHYLLFVGARCFLMLDHALMRHNRPHGRWEAGF